VVLAVIVPRCTACHRPLTNAASTARGLGPVCAERRGAVDTKRKRTRSKATPRVRARRSRRTKWMQLEMFEAAPASERAVNSK